MIIERSGRANSIDGNDCNISDDNSNTCYWYEWSRLNEDQCRIALQVEHGLVCVTGNHKAATSVSKTTCGQDSLTVFTFVVHLL